MQLDSAEQWLRDNDVRYEATSKTWRYLDQPPGQEISVGDENDLAKLVEGRKGSYVVPRDERTCELCGKLFAPRETRQRFCSERHRETAKKRRQRCPRSA